MDELNPDDNQEKGILPEALNAGATTCMSGSDEQEYLRATWEKLGAGQDGLLSLNDLGKVCRAIGIEEENIHVIEKLFKGLDVDGDGRITFGEFVEIFNSANQSQVFDNSFKQETFDCPTSRLTSTRSTDMFTEVGTLHSLDPDDTGHVQVSRLLEVWCSLGIQTGERFLKGAGLPYLPRDQIYLSDLSSAMEEELRRQEEPKQYGAYLLLHEMRDLRSSLDTCREEKNKYRCDLVEANQRISHLVQEIDENNIQVETASKQKISNLERQYKEQIKEFTDALQTEEEVSRDKVTTDIKQFEIRNAILKEEENRLKQQIALQDNDIRKLVSENVDVTDNLKEAQRQVDFMEKQIGELRFLELKMAEYEQSSPREDAYKSLMQKVDYLSCQNQVLRDKNDELLSKMDAFVYKGTCPEQDEGSLDGSIIGDYLDPTSLTSAGSLKRRSHLSGGQERDSKIMKKSSDFCQKHINIHYVDVGAYDESFDTSLPSHADNKCLVRTFDPINVRSEELSPRSNRYHLQSPILSSPPASLGNEQLEDVNSFCKSLGFERIPMASTPHKTKCYNCDHVVEKLKNFNDILIGMKVEEGNLVLGEATNSAGRDTNNTEKSNKIIGINTTIVIAKLQDRLEMTVKTFNSLLQKYKMEKSVLDQFNSRYNTLTDKIKRKRITLTKFMTDEGITTIPEEEEALTGLSEKGLTLDLLESEFCLYEEKLLRERDNLEKQKAVVEERNLRMEKEIEILKTDLGGADDYWQMKIKEEQDYYEEERKLYDEKFLELEKKIKEYEVLLKIDSSSVAQTENSDDSDRLSTIDENVYWEKHITEIEEELSLVQQRNEVLAKDLEHLKLAHERERKNSSVKFEAEILRLKLEVECLRANMSTSVKSDEVREARESRERKRPKVETHASYDISNQLVQAKMRIHKLESTLKILQKSTCEMLSQTQERHHAEIEAQQTIIDSTQQYLTSCLAKYKDQTVKVYKTDTLVKNLCLENTHLMLALQVTEERQKKAESGLRTLEMSQICSL